MEKKQYCKPEVNHLGTVQELTAGGSGNATEDAQGGGGGLNRRT